MLTRSLLPVLLLVLVARGGWAQPSVARPGVAWPGVARPDSLLRLSPARRYEAIATTYEAELRRNPGEARRMRAELAALFEHHPEKDQLLWQVALLDKERFLGIDLERFPARATTLLQQAVALRDTIATVTLHMQLGHYHFDVLKNYYAAFRYFGRVVDVIKHRSQVDFPRRDDVVYELAEALYIFADYPRAIEMGRLIHRPEYRYAPKHRIYNAALVGMSHLNLGQYDSARTYFEWGLRQPDLPGFPNEAWDGIFSGDLGLALAAQGKIGEARSFLEKGFLLSTKHRLWDNVAPFGAQLALLHLPDRLSETRRYARLAHQAARRDGAPRRLYRTHSVLARYFQRAGQTALALAHADSAAVAKDRWQAELNVAHKYQAEMSLETERYQAREREFEQERSRQVLLRNGLLALLVLAAGVGGLLYNRQVLVHRHRQQQAQAQLDHYLHNIREKNLLIERITADLAQATDPALRSEADPAAALLDSVILTDDDWQRFRQLFERVHPRFFERLHDAHPDLTPADTRLVALSKLALPTREMAAMLGISPGSVRKARYRLRQKLEQAGADEALLALIRVG